VTSTQDPRSGAAAWRLAIECQGLEGRRIVKHEMRTTVELGDLIQAVFDEAARHSTDPREVSRLATQAVAQLLYRHLLKQRGPRPPRMPN
jgi:hypothetical protein